MYTKRWSRNRKVNGREPFARITQSVKILAIILSPMAAIGCSSRTLIITQDDHINNAMHQHRPAARQTGDPLEVTIVCVYPSDIELEENGLLTRGSKITAKDWYDRRPTKGRTDGARFKLPQSQIYLLTNAPGTEVYGKVLGPALRGATIEGQQARSAGGIRCQHLHNWDTAIYIFPKFIGSDGQVLPVRPAEYRPPGAFGSKLSVRIGVSAGQGVAGQYIENLSQRKLHGSGVNN